MLYAMSFEHTEWDTEDYLIWFYDYGFIADSDREALEFHEAVADYLHNIEVPSLLTIYRADDVDIVGVETGGYEPPLVTVSGSAESLLNFITAWKPHEIGDEKELIEDFDTLKREGHVKLRSLGYELSARSS